MSYTFIDQSPQRPMLRRYVVDSFDDIATIKNKDQLLPGSTVFVIETNQWYALTHAGSWAEVTISTSEGSGGSSNSEYNITRTVEYIVPITNLDLSQSTLNEYEYEQYFEIENITYDSEAEYPQDDLFNNCPDTLIIKFNGVEYSCLKKTIIYDAHYGEGAIYGDLSNGYINYPFSFTIKLLNDELKGILRYPNDIVVNDTEFSVKTEETIEITTTEDFEAAVRAVNEKYIYATNSTIIIPEQSIILTDENNNEDPSNEDPSVINPNFSKGKSNTKVLNPGEFPSPIFGNYHENSITVQNIDYDIASGRSFASVCPNTLKVTFNNEIYYVDKKFVGDDTVIYGETNIDSPDFTNYPFVINISRDGGDITGNIRWSTDIENITVKGESIDIQVSNEFTTVVNKIIADNNKLQIIFNFDENDEIICDTPFIDIYNCIQYQKPIYAFLISEYNQTFNNIGNYIYDQNAVGFSFLGNDLTSVINIQYNSDGTINYTEYTTNITLTEYEEENG